MWRFGSNSERIESVQIPSKIARLTRLKAATQKELKDSFDRQWAGTASQAATQKELKAMSLSAPSALSSAAATQKELKANSSSARTLTPHHPPAATQEELKGSAANRL